MRHKTNKTPRSPKHSSRNEDIGFVTLTSTQSSLLRALLKTITRSANASKQLTLPTRANVIQSLLLKRSAPTVPDRTVFAKFKEHAPKAPSRKDTKTSVEMEIEFHKLRFCRCLKRIPQFAQNSFFKLTSAPQLKQVSPLGGGIGGVKFGVIFAFFSIIEYSNALFFATIERPNRPAATQRSQKAKRNNRVILTRFDANAFHRSNQQKTGACSAKGQR